MAGSSSVPHGWREARLGDMVSLRGGLSYKAEFIAESGNPLVTMGCVSSAEQFNIKGLQRYRGPFTEVHTLKPGDIVIATRDVTQNRRLLGSPALVPQSLPGGVAIAATNLYKLTNLSDSPNEFLYWMMRAPPYRDHIIASAKGTTIVMLTKDAVENYTFPLPPLPEQRAIAGVLGALDDKIEVNRKTARVLEGIARAVFTSWFVDFDPVRRRAASRPAQPAAPLPADLAALFPTRLVDSPIGEVPEGWRVARVDEVCAFEYGKAMKAEDRKVGTVSVFGSNGQIGTHDTALVRGPGVVVGRKGNPGTVIWVESDFFPIDTTFYVAPGASIGDGTAYFLYWSLERLNLPRLSADSAVPGLNRNMAYGEQIVIPDAKMIATFDALMSPLRRRCANAARQSATLAALRDALLPKLISGELRIADAEKIVGRATA